VPGPSAAIAPTHAISLGPVSVGSTSHTPVEARATAPVERSAAARVSETADDKLFIPRPPSRMIGEPIARRQPRSDELARSPRFRAPPERLRCAAMTEDITELTARYTYGTWRAQRGWKPIHVTKAEGCYFWDASGKRYLDFASQLICSNLGHQNQAV